MTTKLTKGNVSVIIAMDDDGGAVTIQMFRDDGCAYFLTTPEELTFEDVVQHYLIRGFVASYTIAG